MRENIIRRMQDCIQNAAALGRNQEKVRARNEREKAEAKWFSDAALRKQHDQEDRQRERKDMDLIEAHLLQEIQALKTDRDAQRVRMESEWVEECRKREADRDDHSLKMRVREAEVQQLIVEKETEHATGIRIV